MPVFTLTDTSKDVWVDTFAVRARELFPEGGGPAWSVSKRTLRGGKREGVDLIEVDNGRLAFSLIPTRGMAFWKAGLTDLPLAWKSPITDGPVHPAFVNLQNGGGLGWLEGFDELLARCGLETNGAPYTDGETRYGLHGRIGNTPARYVSVQAGDRPDAPIVVEGHVDETRLFFTQVRMKTTVTTAPGSRLVTVRDEFFNPSDTPQEVEILYHWNFGPPLLEEGARFAAPLKTVVPRNARAAEGLGHFDVYNAPEPGFAEQVYFFELLADPADGRTLTLLRDRAGSKGVALRFLKSELPAFTLWKATGGLKSGYVTGLEPGTNYPNPKPFEKKNGRVVSLEPGGSYVAETTLEVLDTAEAVAAAEAEIARIQKQAAPVIHKDPVAPFASP